MGAEEGFLWGLFGGAAAELLGLFRLRRELAEKLPAWVRSPIYWAVTASMIAASGGLVVVYVKAHFTLNSLLAVNIGASAPLILGALAENLPSPPLGKVD